MSAQINTRIGKTQIDTRIDTKADTAQINIAKTVAAQAKAVKIAQRR